MEEIRRRVQQARRRLILEQFVRVAPWCLFAALLVASAGLAVPKLVYLGVNLQQWNLSWLGGSLLAGLVLAVVVTAIKRRNALDAAIEVDRRFGLKERVSSALALSPEDLETEAAQALIHDASRRVERVSVQDEFQVSFSRKTLLPLIPAALVFLLASNLVPDARQDEVRAANTTAEKKRVQKAAAALRKELAKRRKDAAAKGLDDAEEMFHKLHQGLKDLESDNGTDRKQALVKLNDLAQEIARRQKALGDSNKMKNQFKGLKNLAKGPADKLADALKDGDFKKALEQMKQLAEKLQGGELSPEEKQQLAAQLEQMQKKLEELVDAHEQAKRELERQIEQKRLEGDMEAAAKLQRKLDELKEQDAQMDRMKRMAEKMGKTSQAMEEGDMKSAAQQLDDIASELDEMQSEMEELESLDEAMDEISMAKDMMMQEGDQIGDMYGFGDSLDQFDMANDGLGEGPGFGYRPEQETEVGEYEARERAKVKQGEAMRIGDAKGPNRAGISLQDIREEMVAGLESEEDPLVEQKLPRSQKDHVRQYYQRLNQRE